VALKGLNNFKITPECALRVKYAKKTWFILLMESKLNEFEILNKLGEGSFGLVYKVKRKADKNIYVMK